MKKALYIYNAASGDQTISNKLDSILGKFQENNILVQPYRLYCGDQDNLQEILKNSDFDMVIISGGDGTINKIINLIIKNNINVPIGLLPSGTCNDFARSLNFTNSMDECIEAIINGKTNDVDVGMINGESFFLGTCAGGFFVDVSYNTDSDFKKTFGPFAYFLQALREMTNKRSFSIKIKTENEVIRRKALLFLIVNGKNAGGFSNIVKEADISDGIMDIILIKDCNNIELANIFFNVLNNDILKNKNVKLIRTKACSIESDVEIPISIDGEKGNGLPMKVEFLNKMLKVFVN